VARAAQLATDGPIDVAHLPAQTRAIATDPEPGGVFQLPPGGVNLEAVEQVLIRQALERARGNKSKAAELLGLTHHTLLYRMEKYGIVGPERE
jgi:transcriptional regulator with PAS, ATPase and Fis domain